MQIARVKLGASTGSDLQLQWGVVQVARKAMRRKKAFPSTRTHDLYMSSRSAISALTPHDLALLGSREGVRQNGPVGQS